MFHIVSVVHIVIGIHCDVAMLFAIMSSLDACLPAALNFANVCSCRRVSFDWHLN